jgi:DNA-binding transcriptional LysR family regulator
MPSSTPFSPPQHHRLPEDAPRGQFHIDGSFFQNVYEKVESVRRISASPLRMRHQRRWCGHDLFASGQTLSAPKGSPYFPDRHPTLQQIAAAPLILFSRTGAIEPFIQKRFAEEGLALRTLITLNNFVAVKTYVTLGLGVAILSGYVITQEDGRRWTSTTWTILPKEAGGAAHPKKEIPSPAVLAFLKTIKPDIAFPG